MPDKTTYIEDSDATLIKPESQRIVTENKSSPEQTSTLSGTGSRLKNRFELLEVIGSGGMGTVYKAIDKRDIEAGNSSFIAIKIINDQYKNDPDLLKALHNEARKTQSLAHPNIITVYDFDRDQDTVFMTMEFIDGTSLDNIIKTNPTGMSVDNALEIITKMSEALIYAHSQHLIHSDFKPNNVLISNNNQTKVFDFGIARLTNMSLSRSFDPGILGGLTPSYASLEMINKETPDPRDDVYALACISYELFSGHHPFQKKSADIAQQEKLTPERINCLNKKQWNTLKQALAFNRKDRTQNVNDFLKNISSTKKAFPYISISIAITSIALIALFFNYYPFETNTLTNKILSPQTTNIPETQSSSQDKTTERSENLVTTDPVEVIQETASINLWTEKNNYTVGEHLQLSFTVDKAMYIRIVTINSLGDIVALFPNPYQTQSFCEPGISYQIPPKGTEFTLDIEGPKGKDMIIALGSEKPIPDYALNIDKTGNVIDPELRDSLIHKLITYSIN